MTKRLCGLLAVAVVVVLAAGVAAVRAELPEGRYRIYRMNGTYVEGDVKERADGSYEVKIGIGTVVIRRNEVKSIVSLEDVQRRQPGVVAPVLDARARSSRRPVSAEEIEEILSGITAEFDPTVRGSSRDDLMGELPLDEDALAEVKRLVGADAKVLIKPHFVMVYTSTPESARKLGSRLEAVWRWNVRFMEMLNLPAQVPEHKLEVVYFGTYKEFEAYNLNQGSNMPPGVLGYYHPEWNRSHFFDLATAPGLASVLERLKEKDIPWRVRQYFTNIITRWVEFKNQEVIQHETGHHIHFNIGLFPRDAFGGGSVPIWLVEGTTMMFEFPPTAAGASLGVLNHYRLDTLRRTWGEHPLTPEDWKMFIIDNSQWRGFHSYQLGWCLVYYLWKKHRDGYARYLRSVFGREEGVTMTNTEREKEFEDIFGRVDEKWVQKLYDFLDTLHVKPSLLPPDLDSPAEPPVDRSSGERSGPRGGRRPG